MDPVSSFQTLVRRGVGVKYQKISASGKHLLLLGVVRLVSFDCAVPHAADFHLLFVFSSVLL